MLFSIDTQYGGLKHPRCENNVTYLARVAARHAGEKQNSRERTEEGRERCENKKQRWSRTVLRVKRFTVVTPRIKYRLSHRNQPKKEDGKTACAYTKLAFIRAVHNEKRSTFESKITRVPVSLVFPPLARKSEGEEEGGTVQVEVFFFLNG